MGLIIYLNGEFVDESEARVSVFDHGLLYGDGVFEGIRAYNGRVFRLQEHIERLYESARTIMLEIGMPQREMSEVVLETLRRNDIRDGYIRLVVTRGWGDLGLDPRKCPRPTVFCIADQIQLYPEECYERGLDIITASTQRSAVNASNPKVKSLNYLNSVLAKIEANLAGAPEAIMLSGEGYVCEGTGDNVFIVKRGRVITPPSYLGLLEGVTRNAVLELAAKLGYPAVEAVFTRHDLYVADECFLTGTACEMIPVVMVDGRTIGEGKPGAVTRVLLQEFRKLAALDGPEIFPAAKATAQSSILQSFPAELDKKVILKAMENNYPEAKTKSDKFRALAKLGYDNSQISKIMGVRYPQVYGVLGASNTAASKIEIDRK